MLRKIVNTLRHGEKRTKKFLISVMGLALAGLGFLVAAIITNAVIFWIAAPAAVLLTAAMAKDAVLVVIKDNEEREAKGEEAVKEEEAARKALKQRKKEERKEKKERKAEDREELSEEEVLEREKEDEEALDEDALDNMTEGKLKQLLIRYKVKQEHVPVVIDLCVSERVKQCPGFAWVEGGKLRILLIESKPRLLERSCHAMQTLEVECGVTVRAGNEYTELRKTEVMNRAFTPYLPRYHKKAVGGRTVLLKNLYILDGDMKFTSGSVSGLKKLFPLRIEINDRRLQEEETSAYCKALFLSSFLWKDGVLTLKEYQKEVERVLENMAAADISYNEFEKNLSEMISSGLLPAEYREFAYAKRERGKAGKEEKKGKRKTRK